MREDDPAAPAMAEAPRSSPPTKPALRKDAPRNTASATISKAFVSSACQRVRQGQPLHRKLPPWGRVHVDRPLPFIVVYRRPSSREDPGTESLIAGEASYVLASGGRRSQSGVTSLIEGIAQTQAESFGGFLILELWSAPDESNQLEGTGWQPGFRIVRSRRSKLASTVDTLERALGEVKIKGEYATVEITFGSSVRPPGMPPLMTAERAAALDCQ